MGFPSPFMTVDLEFHDTGLVKLSRSESLRILLFDREWDLDCHGDQYVSETSMNQ